MAHLKNISKFQLITWHCCISRWSQQNRNSLNEPLDVFNFGVRFALQIVYVRCRHQ